MTSQKDIQSLIADLDSILPKVDARLPWSKPGNVARERRILERVRNYLVSQQQGFIATPQELPLATTAAQPEVVQILTQAITRELNFLRADLIGPLQADVEALRQQREALMQEIRQLEHKRKQIDSFNQGSTQDQQMISEFSQGLINRYTETLRQQLAQILANFKAGVVNATPPRSPIIPAFPNHESVEGVMHSQVTSEQLRQLQQKSDQMLIILEANQRAIFETLQRDLQAYQASLSQGLEKMHSLGEQSERLFTTLMNRTLEQLRQQPPTLSSASVNLSDAARQTQEASISTTPAATLLPRNTPPVAEGVLQPNQALTEQFPQSIETGLLAQQSAEENEINLISTNDIEMIPKTDKAQSSPSLADPSVLSSEDSFLENLNSEDWEIIEGTDSVALPFELDDNEQIDTFIQLDINNQDSLSSLEADYTLNPSDTQESDFLLSWLNEKQQSALDPQSGKVTELGTSEVAAELTSSVDRHRQEIDELYQSLFGTDSLNNTANLDESDFAGESESNSSEPMSASEDLQPQEDDRLTNADIVNSLPQQVENALFEGLADPATVASQEQPLDPVLFEDSLPLSPQPTNLAPASQLSSSASDSLFHDFSTSEQDRIETITALTDLFETLGLTPPAPATESNSISIPIAQPSQTPASDTAPEVNLVEDTYIPASPDEDLLETNTIESTPNVDIRLNQNTLQQFQQDLYSFEISGGENISRQEEQWLHDNYTQEPTATPEAEQLEQQNRQFPMSQELLAEDWEDFILNQYLNLREPWELADDAIPTTAESVESDFEPDLFPSEVLELDHESTVNAGATSAEELNLPGELLAFEDENLVDEMQWDEPTDNITEETIASSEMEFDGDFFGQTVLNSEVAGEDSTAIGDTLRDEVQDHSSDLAQAPTLPQNSLEHNSDTLPEAGVNLEQQHSENVEDSTPENKVATEPEQLPPKNEDGSQGMAPTEQTQTAQAPDQSNFEVNFPQSEALNSEQADNQPNINPDSDSESQP